MRNKTVILGVGSNLENPLNNLRQALSFLKKSKFFQVKNVSSVYESDAQLPEGASKEWNIHYLNAAVLCEIDKSVAAEEILFEVKKIERAMGRKTTERWAPRLIDLDILYWSEGVFKSDNLQIPHKELLKRPFALLPALEICSSLRHEIGAELPIWSQGFYETKPYNTKISNNYFWPKRVGILNITSDSFSDGGLNLNSEDLVLRFKKLVSQGAEIIDIGAESTRPGAAPVPMEEEFKSLDWALSEISKLSESRNCLLSLDSYKSEVILRILENHKIDFLNDVTGFRSLEMQNILIKSKLKAFVMHSLSVPPVLSENLDFEINPCEQLAKWFLNKKNTLLELGASENQIIFDVGIGFGKTKVQNLYILNHLEEFVQIQEDIMVGHSRKSFLTLFSDRKAEERDLETALVSQNLNLAYVQYLRLHDLSSQTIALRAKSFL